MTCFTVRLNFSRFWLRFGLPHCAFALAGLIASALNAVAANESAANLPEGYIQGTPWSGAPGVTERTSDIMARGRVLAGTHHPYRIHARPQTDFSDESHAHNDFPQNPNFPLTDAPVA